MAVGLNRFGMVHDLYFPYVGLENHSSEKSSRHRVGLFIDGAMHWIDDGTWDIKQTYMQARLIGKTKAINRNLDVEVNFQDFVDHESNVFARNVEIINLRGQERHIKLYMHQAFIISEANDGHDTAQYIPLSEKESESILHYKGRRAFIISGDSFQTGKSFDSFSVGRFGDFGHEKHDGVWRDAEDGVLSRNPVERVQTDSIIEFNLQLQAHDSARVHYYLSAGKSILEARKTLERFKKEGLIEKLLKTDLFWRDWIAPASAIAEVHVLPEYRSNFLNSMLILKAMMDRRGAVMASLDTEMLKYTRDAYVDCWPRDASYVFMVFWKLGYIDEVKQFFRFAKDIISSEGFFWQMYRPDSSIGPNSHSYIHDNLEPSPPIQADETATILFLFAKVVKLDIQRGGRIEDWRELYEELGRPAANFLSKYIDTITGLPKPSYEIWEVLYETTTYTTAATYGALNAATDLAEIFGETSNLTNWRNIAGTIRKNAGMLWNPERNYFYRGILNRQDGKFDYDSNIDVASFYGAWVFDLFDHDKLAIAFKTVTDRFHLKHNNVGTPRFEDDDYNREDASSDGNPWFITSFWLAQYQALQFHENHDSEKRLFTKYVLDWANAQMDKTNILPEQVNPHNREMVSAAPLAWSHAEFINTCLSYGNNFDNTEGVV